MENEVQSETVRQEESPAPVTAEQQEPVVESAPEDTAVRPRPEPIPVTEQVPSPLEEKARLFGLKGLSDRDGPHR